MEEENNYGQGNEENNTPEPEMTQDTPKVCENCESTTCDGSCAMNDMHSRGDMGTTEGSAGACKCGTANCKCGMKKIIIKVIVIVVIIWVLTLIF